ncbi:sensor histidine kinase [Virgibacillus dokdonensis]|uniref:histidine kinase n=1 Tax=Virgibacillus dokdonensis TaxID=302167 RepID=A0A3E0WWV1_9BACI|nr:LytS/YhcK type 5TM receptor domain-containing protein [Virgibacillus dokdonensis]RFA36653.1 sensor histidine kinase [Virgibacillus dokdonensis]
MFDLLVMMLERLGIIVMIAFLLTRLQFFRNMISQHTLSQSQQYKAMLFFGLFGIIGTYTGLIFNTGTSEIERWRIGIEPDEAIANFRVIGVVVAGLLGGYRIGIGAGIIAGVHRFLLGGYTALSCGIATIIAGFFAGYFHKNQSHHSLPKVFVITATAEIIQMLLIILLAGSFEQNIPLVQVIGLPMVIANGLGGALFMLIIQMVIQEEDKVGAVQAQLTLRIADKTLAYLRKGLNEQTAQAACNILYQEMNAIAVSITNDKEILAHVGLADDHHKQRNPIQTQITRDTIQSGELIVASGQQIHCSHDNCPLKAVVIAPLKQRGETIGTLKFYYHSKEDINRLVREMVSGLAKLLSNQLEIAHAEEALQLAKASEINALQAQIRPHFLFNTLNTITSLTRIDPMKARKLLVSLSHFLRQNLTVTTDQEVTIDQELKHVQAYLDIEQTRFHDRLHVDYYIDDDCLQQTVPPLILQPIVENAMKHGLKDKKENANIVIQIYNKNDHTHISVSDNGKGIPNKKMNCIGKKMVSSKSGTGMALYNINRRLTMKFGPSAKLLITSKIHEGTCVQFSITRTKA